MVVLLDIISGSMENGEPIGDFLRTRFSEGYYVFMCDQEGPLIFQGKKKQHHKVYLPGNFRDVVFDIISSLYNYRNSEQNNHLTNGDTPIDVIVPFGAIDYFKSLNGAIVFINGKFVQMLIKDVDKISALPKEREVRNNISLEDLLSSTFAMLTARWNSASEGILDQRFGYYIFNGWDGINFDSLYDLMKFFLNAKETEKKLILTSLRRQLSSVKSNKYIHYSVSVKEVDLPEILETERGLLSHQNPPNTYRDSRGNLVILGPKEYRKASYIPLEWSKPGFIYYFPSYEKEINPEQWLVSVKKGKKIETQQLSQILRNHNLRGIPVIVGYKENIPIWQICYSNGVLSDEQFQGYDSLWEYFAIENNLAVVVTNEENYNSFLKFMKKQYQKKRWKGKLWLYDGSEKIWEILSYNQ